MTSLTTTSETTGKDQVKLTVEVPETELKSALDAVYRRWANDIKVPGFRPGKVPRQMIDARVGVDAIREEALREALPDLYQEALKEADVEAIAPPDIEVTKFETGEPIVFEATVDIRPEVTVPELSEIKVTAPPQEVTEEEMNEQLERLRDRFAELEPIGREARRGDFVLIDLKGFQGTEPVEGASAPDFLYEVGSGQGPAKLDAELEGARPGAILKFTDSVHIHREDEPEHDHSHMEEISFTVLVKEVKAKKLPALDEEFAKTVGEFDTLDDLKEDLKTRMADMKVNLVEEELRSLALQALVDASDLEPPEKLVEGEFTHRLQHIEQDLVGAGMTLAQYAEGSGSTELEVRTDIRTQAAQSVKAELLLEEIARTEGYGVTQEDIGLEIAYIAARAQRDAKEVAEQLVSQGRLGALAGDILRRKALDHVLDHIEVENRPVRSEPVVPESPSEAHDEPTAAPEASGTE